MQRKGSKVLLCFWQWGHVREDLQKTKCKIHINITYNLISRQHKGNLICSYLYWAWKSSCTKVLQTGKDGPSGIISDSDGGLKEESTISQTESTNYWLKMTWQWHKCPWLLIQAMHQVQMFQWKVSAKGTRTQQPGRGSQELISSQALPHLCLSTPSRRFLPRTLQSPSNSRCPALTSFRKLIPTTEFLARIGCWFWYLITLLHISLTFPCLSTNSHWVPAITCREHGRGL